MLLCYPLYFRKGRVIIAMVRFRGRDELSGSVKSGLKNGLIIVAEKINYGIMKVPNLYLHLGKHERDELQQSWIALSRLTACEINQLNAVMLNGMNGCSFPLE